MPIDFYDDPASGNDFIRKETLPFFDIRAFGAKAGDTSAATRTANNTALRDAIRAASPNATNTDPNNAIDEPRGGMVFIPAGIWYFEAPSGTAGASPSAAIELDREVVIQGVSGAGREGAGSVLRFPSGVTGIIVQRYNTSDLEANIPPRIKQRQGRGDFSVIRDVSLQGEGTRSGTADGIRMYARAKIENCFIKNFGRDGIHIGTEATEENVPNRAQPTINVTDLNADNWEVQNVRVEACGRNGLYVKGINSNAGRAIGLDCSQNLEWGIQDISFLGNTYLECHTEGNGRVNPANSSQYSQQQPVQPTAASTSVVVTTLTAATTEAPF